MNLSEDKRVTCFLPYSGEEILSLTVKELRTCKEIDNIFVICPHSVEGECATSLPEGCQGLPAGILQQTQTLKTLASHIDTPYILLYTSALPLKLGAYSIERMLQVISNTDAGMLYADHYKTKKGQLQPHPVNDYQEGSLRDDFDFGSLLLYNTQAFKAAVSEMNVDYQVAALYDLRLKISKYKSLFHLREFLYTEEETDMRKSGEKQFDYVNPKNRHVQIEMEQVCTQYLKDTGAWLKPEFSEI